MCTHTTTVQRHPRRRRLRVPGGARDHRRADHGLHGAFRFVFWLFVLDVSRPRPLSSSTMTDRWSNVVGIRAQPTSNNQTSTYEQHQTPPPTENTTGALPLLHRDHQGQVGHPPQRAARLSRRLRAVRAPPFLWLVGSVVAVGIYTHLGEHPPP